MQPTIQTIPSKKLVGQRVRTNLLVDKTFELWSGFMPHRSEIVNNVSDELYSVQIMSPLYFKSFNPRSEFEKWAAIEVDHYDSIPPTMESITIPSGLYAVFVHKGRAVDGPKTFQYIFTNWLPASNYQLDDRPHFAIMGANYKHNDPESEEEIWVPISPKS
jgi:AraC family transcriptional regulator